MLPSGGLREGSGLSAGGLYVSAQFRACLIAADPHRPPRALPLHKSTTADNRLVWQSIQTLEPKQP